MLNTSNETQAPPPHAQQATPAVTAIDILLEPDATMLQHAQAVNDRRIFHRVTFPRSSRP
jgi:hypothetical protein